MPTVLYSENNYPDDSVERRIYGPDVKIVFPRPPPRSPISPMRNAPRRMG